MANQTIYICDKCESYVPASDMYRVPFNYPVRAGSTYELSWENLASPLKKQYTIYRELCAVCVKKMASDYKLTEEEITIKNTLFKDFSTPNSK